MKKNKWLFISLGFLFVFCFSLWGIFAFMPVGNIEDVEEEVITDQPRREGPVYFAAASEETGASEASRSDKGGAIYVGNGSTFEFVGGSIKNHKAEYGGAVYIANGGRFVMTAGTISGNFATYGGAIYIEDGGTCEISGGTIINNGATEGGSIYVEDGGNLKVSSDAVIEDGVYEEQPEVTPPVPEEPEDPEEPTGPIVGDIVDLVIGETTYQAVYGSKWSDWIASSYNTDSFTTLDDGRLTKTVGETKYEVLYVNNGETVSVLQTEEIDFEKSYILGIYVEEGTGIEDGTINIYVDGVLNKTLNIEGGSYTLVESDMPLDYEHCCGYFYDVNLTKTVYDNVVDMSNGGVNLYTKTSFLPSTVTFSGGVAILPYEGTNSTDVYDIVFPQERNGVTITRIENDMTRDYGVCDFGINSVVFPAKLNSIGGYAFYGTDMTSIVTNDSMVSIEVDAFWHCNYITSIYIASRIIDVNKLAFPDCNNIESIIVDEKNVKYDSRDNCNAIIETSTNSLFLGCKGSIIPDGVTAIGDSAFSGRTGLESIVIPEGVTSIGEYSFSGCTGLTSIIIPEGVTSIGKQAFSGCTGLTSIIIPQSVTSIERAIFYNCTGLTSIVIPEGVTSIGENVFSNCSALISITIPNGVTSIGRYAFSLCTQLQEFYIPSSVTEMGDGVFHYCTALKEIKCEAVSQPEGWDDDWNLNCDATVTWGVSSTITFYVDDVAYQAGRGMTWEVWLNSSYNTYGWYYEDPTGIVVNDVKQYITEVKTTDKIIENNYYRAGHTGGAAN